MMNRARRRFGTGLAAAGMLLVLWAAATSAADATRLELKKGDRIIIIGNTLAERMQYYGHFETLLHSRFPELELVVHDLGWSADEVALRPRQAHFNDHGHTLKDEKPDVLIAAFGFNESFGGPAGLPKFRRDLERFIGESTTTKYNGKSAPRLVLLSPIAQEDLKNPHITDGKKNNENIKLYADAMAELAGKHGVLFVNLFTPTQKLYQSAEHPLTINGVHLSDEGYRQLAPVLDEALFGPRPASIKADMKALLRRRPGEEPPVLLRLSRRQRLLHLRRPQGPLRRGQLPGRVRQAPQDDPEPRAADLGHRPGQERPGDDRRQQHRRIRQGRDQLQAAASTSRRPRRS